MKSSVVFALAMMGVASVISGCGGGAGGPDVASSKGSLTVKLVWPTPKSSRVIPLASQSVNVVLKDSGGNTAAQGLIAKPSTTWTSGQLSPGTYSIAATAYPNSAGSGTAQAAGSGSVTIIAGQNTPAGVTMASKVAHVAVTGSGSNMLLLGAGKQISASCTDASGSIVLVDPSTLSWSSSDTSKATVSSTGVVTAVATGIPTVKATFTEVESTLGQTPLASNSLPVDVYANSSSVPPGYSLVWSDEFVQTVGSLPNPANWTYDLGAGGWGNNEQETYTNSNATVVSDAAASDGLALDIKATTDGTKFYSSRLKTEGLQSFTYGYIEVRAKVPPGGANYQGYWPAFWMLGNSITSVGWPTCGEQDIMEHLCGTQPTNAYQSLHGNNAGSGWTTTNTYTAPSDLGAGYHTYGVLWKQNSITFYTDGIANGAPITPSTIGGGNVWEFNQAEFLILNMAVGGYWPGYTTNATQFPAHFMIDYVRVYQ